MLDVANVGLRFSPLQREFIESDEPRKVLEDYRATGRSTTLAFCALREAVSKDGSEVALVAPTLRQATGLLGKVWALCGLGGITCWTGRPRLTLELESGSTNSTIRFFSPTDEDIRGNRFDFLGVDDAEYVPDALFHVVAACVAAGGSVALVHERDAASSELVGELETLRILQDEKAMKALQRVSGDREERPA